MWLRLTAPNSLIIIINFNNVNSFSKYQEGSIIYYTCSDSNETSIVKESIDEIEIMLAGKGAEVKRADKGRDYIGSKLTGPGDVF